MARRLIRYAFASLIIFASIIGRAATPETLVRVLDITEVEGIPGVVLLVNTGRSDSIQAFVTDGQGFASIPKQNCSICMITALDPKGAFFSKTTEFDGQSSAVTLILQVQPIIDSVGSPDAVWVNFRIYGPGGVLMTNQRVMVRNAVVSLDPNWLFIITTNSKGLVSEEFAPGEYTIATLIEERPWEATIRVVGRRSKCAKHVQNCIESSSIGSGSSQLMDIQLSAAGTTSQ